MHTIVVMNWKTLRSFPRSPTTLRQGLLRHTEHKHTYLVPSVQHTSKDGIFTYLMLQLCSSRWLIPKILLWSLHHNVFLCLCHRRTSPSLHANLLQSSNTAPNLPKNILQSTDEESVNIILVCYERCLLSLQEWSVCFTPIVALIWGFLMKPFFWANCIQLGKIFAHPITGQSIQHLRVQYISKNSDAQRQWMARHLCFFKYISQTCDNKQAKKQCNKSRKTKQLGQGNLRNLMYQKSRNFLVLWEITIQHVSSTAGIPSREWFGWWHVDLPCRTKAQILQQICRIFKQICCSGRAFTLAEASKDRWTVTALV